jgi:hypothetical protein
MREYLRKGRLAHARLVYDHHLPLPYKLLVLKASNMDMDYEDEVASQVKSAPEPHGALIVSVDDSHPFDLNAYISNYSGMRRYTRQKVYNIHIRQL